MKQNYGEKRVCPRQNQIFTFWDKKMVGNLPDITSHISKGISYIENYTVKDRTCPPFFCTLSDNVFQMIMFPITFHLHWALQELVWTLWNCAVVVGFRFVDFLWMLPFKAARLMPLQLIVQLKGHQRDLPPLQMAACQYYPTRIMHKRIFCACRLRWLGGCTNIYSAVFDAV